MFSKIGEFLKPPAAPKDGMPAHAPSRVGQERGAQSVRDDEEKKERGGRKQDDAQEDLMLFSTSAIRAILEKDDAKTMIAAENSAATPADLLACLDILERNDIRSVPVRGNQSVTAAVLEAARFFGSVPV